MSNDDYSDIIGMDHHVSKRHKPMPMENRAAQFAPFAALTGHDEAIGETARLTSEKIELTPDQQALLSEYIRQAHESKATVAISFFVPDMSKAGGEYITIQGIIRKIEMVEHAIHLSGGHIIPIDSINDVKLLSQ